MSQKHRTYKQIKQEFSPEMQTEISIGAQKIRKELKMMELVARSIAYGRSRSVGED